MKIELLPITGVQNPAAGADRFGGDNLEIQP